MGTPRRRPRQAGGQAVILAILAAAAVSQPGCSYTLHDLDRMRAAVSELLQPPPNTPYYETELHARIEDQLRTDMAACIAPAELEKAANEKTSAEFARLKEENSNIIWVSPAPKKPPAKPRRRA